MNILMHLLFFGQEIFSNLVRIEFILGISFVLFQLFLRLMIRICIKKVQNKNAFTHLIMRSLGNQ